MPHEVLYHRDAAKQLERPKDKTFEKIQEEIDGLANDPRPVGVEKIGEDEYRIRVGDWRIIYFINDKDKVILISGVRRRNESTYKR